jgi:hypothetical protein
MSSAPERRNSFFRNVAMAHLYTVMLLEMPLHCERRENKLKGIKSSVTLRLLTILQQKGLIQSSHSSAFENLLRTLTQFLFLNELGRLSTVYI